MVTLKSVSQERVAAHLCAFNGVLGALPLTSRGEFSCSGNSPNMQKRALFALLATISTPFSWRQIINQKSDSAKNRVGKHRHIK